jgi:hypothetical protein
LERDLCLDRATLGHNQRPLERDGLLAIMVDKAGRLAHSIVLTEKRLRRLQESEKIHRTGARGVRTEFGPEGDPAAAPNDGRNRNDQVQPLVAASCLLAQRISWPLLISVWPETIQSASPFYGCTEAGSGDGAVGTEPACFSLNAPILLRKAKPLQVCQIAMQEGLDNVLDADLRTNCEDKCGRNRNRNKRSNCDCLHPYRP